MGTRSLTIIRDEKGRDLVTLYRQFDGYPTGHGAELGKILRAKVQTNGIDTRADKATIFNGADDLAAQVVAVLKFREEHELKNGEWVSAGLGAWPGNFYIVAPGTRDAGEEYLWIIEPQGVGKCARVLCYEAGASAAEDQLLFDVQAVDMTDEYLAKAESEEAEAPTA